MNQDNLLKFLKKSQILKKNSWNYHHVEFFKFNSSILANVQQKIYRVKILLIKYYFFNMHLYKDCFKFNHDDFPSQKSTRRASLSWTSWTIWWSWVLCTIVTLPMGPAMFLVLAMTWCTRTRGIIATVWNLTKGCRSNVCWPRSAETGTGWVPITDSYRWLI